MPEPSATLPRDAALDGLRGLAVAAVVFVHYTFYSGLMPIPGSGYLGVAIFFVLSGYLITRVVWRDGRPQAPGVYGRFVRRRVKRLYPALLGMVVVATPVMAAVGPETLAMDVRAAVVAAAQLSAFAEVWGDPVLEPWFPTWSLTVEWTFYLSWPLMLGRLAARGTTALVASRVAAMGALVLYAVSLPLSPAALYVLPLANLGVMLAGAALALLHAHHDEAGTSQDRGRDPGIALMGLCLFLVMVIVPGPGSAHVAYRLMMLPAAVVAALVLIDQRPGTRGPARAFLELSAMRTLGWISYSVYLWHIPVLWTVWFALPGVSPLLRVAVAAGVLVPVVWASFVFLERPWLHLRRPVDASTGRGLRTAGAEG